MEILRKHPYISLTFDSGWCGANPVSDMGYVFMAGAGKYGALAPEDASVENNLKFGFKMYSCSKPTERERKKRLNG